MSKTNYQFQIRNIGHIMKQLGDQKLEQYGLTSEQGHVVGYLVGHMEENITQKELEKVFQRKASTISSIVTNLEKNNFVQRKIDPTDERRKIIQPLQRAIDVTLEYEVFFEDLEVGMAQGFSAQEKVELSQLLERTIVNLTQMKR